MRSGPATACPAHSAGTCPAGDGAGQAPPGLSGYAAWLGPPHPRVSPAVPPRRPRLVPRRGLVCGCPACLAVLSGLVVGSPPVAPPPPRSLTPKPARRPLPLCAGGRRYRSWRRLSRPAARPGRAARASPPWGPLRALCAAHLRAGAPLPLSLVGVVVARGRVPPLRGLGCSSPSPGFFAAGLRTAASPPPALFPAHRFPRGLRRFRLGFRSPRRRLSPSALAQAAARASVPCPSPSHGAFVRHVAPAGA